MDISEQNSLAKKGYKFIGNIGKGAYSTVRLFYSEKLKYHVALKIINKNLVPNEYCTKFLPREVDILYKAKHCNITLCDKIMASSSGKIYISLEYSKYEDLLKHIVANGAFEEQKAKYLFKQLTNAIKYLHGIGIAHRDLKCENILLTNSSITKSRQLDDIQISSETMQICQLRLDSNFDPKEIKILLTDFSFAREFKANELSRTFCGSAVYTSPEVVQGLPYLIPQQDMWSLGIVLFIMVCGSMPYNDDKLSAMVKEQLAHKINFTPKYLIKLSKQCKDLIYKLIQPNVSRRLTAEQVEHHSWIYNQIDCSDGEFECLNDKLDLGKDIMHKKETNKSKLSYDTTETIK